MKSPHELNSTQCEFDSIFLLRLNGVHLTPIDSETLFHISVTLRHDFSKAGCFKACTKLSHLKGIAKEKQNKEWKANEKFKTVLERNRAQIVFLQFPLNPSIVTQNLKQ